MSSRSRTGIAWWPLLSVVLAALAGGVWVMLLPMLTGPRWPNPAVVVGAALAAAIGAATVGMSRPAVQQWIDRVEIPADTADAGALPVLVSMLWSAIVVVGYGNPASAGWFLVATFGAWVAWIDARTHRIPNALSWWLTGAVAVLLAVSTWADPTPDIPALVRAATAMVVVPAGLLALAIATRGVIGLGDVWFAAPLMGIAAYGGWSIVASAFVMTLIIWLPFIVAGRARGSLSRSAPAGPYLLAGTAVALAGSPVTVVVAAVSALATVIALLVAVRRLLGPAGRSRGYVAAVVAAMLLAPLALVAAVVFVWPLEAFVVAAAATVLVYTVVLIAVTRPLRHDESSTPPEPAAADA